MIVVPTACFGPISYFQEIAQHDEIAILGEETYPKQTERNRYAIATSQGIQWLTIPVKRIDGSKTITSRIEIDNKTDWQKKHWRAIETAYNSSPFFEHYSSDLKEMIFHRENNLLKFNCNVLTKFLSIFQLHISYYIDNEFVKLKNDFFKQNNSVKIDSYQQVLFKTNTFEHNLSIIDLLCCEGPIGRNILKLFKT